MAAELRDARLLTVSGYGNTTLLDPSTCAADHKTACLVRGVLPPRGTVCWQDVPPLAETAPAASR
ncbi:alpha/beta hydrolase [Streptomyces sp. NPDC097981]|uniref:alpha/beta hydrolase n=1 Tax=Streptomyces sp. NPDC097981 TaxID=3155428 RepID=UPI0033281E19